MSTIVTRAGKGSALTHTEVDANFTNLNNDKIQSGDTVASLTITSADINGGTVDGTAIGGSSASTGAFTTLSASSTVSGTGFSNYLASPPAIGGTSAAAGTFTALTSTGNTTLGDAVGDTVTVNGTATFVNANPTLSAGTANGLVYLNGSKVATSGSALTYDGTTFTSGAHTVSTGVLTVPAGSNTAPSITFSGDTNTGIFSPAADTVAIGTGGSERVRVDSNGNVGVGTTPLSSSYRITSSGGRVNFAGNSDGLNLYLQYSSATLGAFVGSPAANVLAFSDSNGTERMRIDSSGKVGIGTTSPQDMLVVSNAGNAGWEVGAATNVTVQAYNRSSAAYVDYKDNCLNRIFATNGTTERARITSAGNLLVGTTSDAAGARLTVINTAASARLMQITKGDTNDYFIVADSLGTNRFLVSGTGAVLALGVYSTVVGATNRDVFVDSVGNLGYVSSLRETKTNIANLTDTSWLYQLNPVTFNYRKKDEEGNYTDETDGDIQYGMIAEDVEQVRPDLCFYDEVDGQQELRGIQYSKLVPVMLKALQELKAELDATKAEVALLKGAA